MAKHLFIVGLVGALVFGIGGLLAIAFVPDNAWTDKPVDLKRLVDFISGTLLGAGLGVGLGAAKTMRERLWVLGLVLAFAMIFLVVAVVPAVRDLIYVAEGQWTNYYFAAGSAFAGVVLSTLLTKSKRWSGNEISGDRPDRRRERDTNGPARVYAPIAAPKDCWVGCILMLIAGCSLGAFQRSTCRTPRRAGRPRRGRGSRT